MRRVVSAEYFLSTYSSNGICYFTNGFVLSLDLVFLSQNYSSTAGQTTIIRQIILIRQIITIRQIIIIRPSGSVVFGQRRRTRLDSFRFRGLRPGLSLLARRSDVLSSFVICRRRSRKFALYRFLGGRADVVEKLTFYSLLSDWCISIRICRRIRCNFTKL